MRLWLARHPALGARRDRSRGIAEGFEAWIRGLAEGLRRIQEAGEIGPEADPDQLATSLMAALQAGTGWPMPPAISGRWKPPSPQ